MSAKSATKLATVPTGSVVPNPRNPRLHPEAQLAHLQASVAAFGQPRPILVRKENRMIVAGHGIHLAMQRAEIPEIQVLLWDVDQATADAFMLADNKLAQQGRDDPDRIGELLAEIGEAEWAAVGFADDEARAILEAAQDSGIAVEEVATDLVADTFWISVRGPLKDQAAALQKLQQVMAEFPAVDVELGTTASL